METHPLARLSTTAAGQSGLFTLAQAECCGRSRKQVYADIDRGLVVRIFQGVFAFAACPTTGHQLLLAATYTHPGRVFAARGSVLRLLGLPARRDGPHIVVPHDLGYDFDDRLHVHTSRTLDRDIPQRIDGVLCASTARSLVEDGMGCPSSFWLDLVSLALQRNLVTLVELSDALVAAGRIPHRAKLRRALETLDPRLVAARSVPELSLVDLVEDVVGARPILNHRILDSTGALIDEVDAALPEVLLAFEGDSRTWHTTPGRMEADLLKDLRLRERGWMCTRLPLRMLHNHPAQFRRAIRTAHDQAVARLPTLPTHLREAAVLHVAERTAP